MRSAGTQSLGVANQRVGVVHLDSRVVGRHRHEGSGGRNCDRGDRPATRRRLSLRDHVEKITDTVVEIGGGRSPDLLSGGVQNSPTVSPEESMSTWAAAGSEPRPGIVRMSPQIGYT